MITFSSSFKLNEIHTVDSPFNEDPKNIFFSREALILGEERPENLRKMDNNRGIYCYANRGLVNFERAYQPLPPGTKILVIPQFSCMRDQILGKNENGPKFDLSLGSFPPKHKDLFKKFDMAKRLWL